MDFPDCSLSQGLLAAVSALLPVWRERAASLDRAAQFPAMEIEALREAGVLYAPLPCRLGGLGWGTEPGASQDILALFQLLGRGNPALGRLVEAHVNAVKLVIEYGTAQQAERIAADIAAGALYGLWVTDDNRDPLRLHDNALHGVKAVCSGAGYVTHALVTATDSNIDRGIEDATRMLVVDVRDHVSVTPGGIALQGMRAATTGRVRFMATPAMPDCIIGHAGDYLRQPIFSTGAWRGSAVALGMMEALLAETQAQLCKRGRDRDPHQLARMGTATIEVETAQLWMRRAAQIAEENTEPAAACVAYVNLARLAVERAALNLMQLAQRSLGFGAFMEGNPVERMGRDLATYLRQPAPDETLTEAAAHTMKHGLP